ncbi:MAG TPA: MMPL family transporter [Stellaceae bacterium]|nr:MMPL family transporter [Stellaceae bacterium]
MIAALIVRLVDAARRRPAANVIAILALTVAAGWYAAGQLAIDTNIENLLPSNLPWRQDEVAMDRAFPQNGNLLAIVIDGTTGELADDAAQRLADRLSAEPNYFSTVRRPDGGPFFDKNGLLFLSVDELNSLSQQLVTAQPLLGSLAADPSLRGLFDTIKLFVEGATRGDVTIDKLDPTLDKIADIVDGVVSGQPVSLSWQAVLSGGKANPRALRKFVLAQPVLDYHSLEPGAKATAEIQRVVAELGLTPQNGVRVRVTGSVALDDDQFATLRKGALRSALLSIGSMLVILFAGLRSPRLVAACLVTVVCGLVLTGAFAALAIGTLNVISVAFGVLFIGLAVDFSIQFSIRYRDQRHQTGVLDAALAAAARTIGPSLMLAAAATAIGFLSFVPTPYVGVRELGWIAGVGMVIAIMLNFTLLPAILTLLSPKPEAEAVGFARAAPIDRFLHKRRGWVVSGAAIVAAVALVLLPRVSFDSDPLDLKNPHSEAMQTITDLMKDPLTTPYTAEILAPNIDAARALADEFEQLPEVSMTVSAASFVPAHQQEKLAILSDLGLLLGPSLTPATILPPPSDAETMTALAGCAVVLRKFIAAHPGDGPTTKLAAALDKADSRGPAIIPTLQKALLSGLLHRIELLGQLLQAKELTLADLPADLRGTWIAANGAARIEVFPKGDARDPAVLKRFVAAVHRVAPQATGTPVTILEAGRLISSAFVEAGVIAVAAITVLLIAVLRRPRDVALVIAPLLLAALLTLAITVVAGIRLNYANIIALPLLLGIGVAFDIYFVMNWRAGLADHLQSSTARAVVFSALTTMCAFGSLALSPDPGEADMGLLLTISLACTVFCTLLVLPALLGPPRPS